jgi:predicted transcriptional regulator
MCATIFFITKYTKLLKLAQKEYVNAKNIVKGVVFHFKAQQDKQTNSIERLSLKVNVVRSDIEDLNKDVRNLENRVVQVKSADQQPSTESKEIIEQLDQIKKEVKIIVEEQSKLNEQIVFLQTRSQDLKKDKKRGSIPESLRLTNLTDTERSVLQLIIKKEANTSSDVERKIRKTREHTARLLRKLWQEGYIERDTHRIPYTYSVPENLKNGVSKKLIR